MFSLEELYSVKGKVVVVTGGGTGLGKSGFVENGAKVYISARRQEVLEKAAKDIEANAKQGGSVHIIVGDVSTKDGCNQIADAIKAKEDKLDVLINCAGVIKGYKQTAHPFDIDAVEKQMLAVDDEDFDYQMKINVNGVYFLTAALISLLRKGTDPSVVVIASIAGVLNQHSMGSLTYGASKAATLHMGKLLAGKLAPFKIRCNTVLPGIFPSEMTGVKQDSGSGLADAADKAVKRSSAGRGGEPHEIVGPILMLSSRGGSFMNGGVITVDGGRCMNAGIHDGIKIPDELLTYT